MKFRLFLLALCAGLFSIYAPAFGQQPKLDSLLQEIRKDIPDSSRYTCYLKIGYHMEQQNFDSALHYYDKALQLAEKQVWISRQAKAKVNMAFAYYYTRGSRKSIELLEEGLGLYQQAKDSSGILDSYYNRGTFLGFFEEYAPAIHSFHNALDICLKLDNEERLGMIYNNLGLMYQYSGLYDKANIYQYKALRLKEESKDPTLAYTHINIGLNYQQQDDHKQSLEHYQTALKLLQASQDSVRMAVAQKNIGDVYLEMREHDQALEYYNLAFAYYERKHDHVSMSSIYRAKGLIASESGKWQEAESYFQQAIAVFPPSGSKRLLFYVYSSYAEFCLNRGQNQKAITYAQEMEKMAASMSSISMNHTAADLLYRIYQKTGNAKLALVYSTKVLAAKDSLYSIQKQKVISETQIRYEVEKKALEIELLSLENKLMKSDLQQHQEQERSQRNTIVLLLIVLVLFVSLALLILVYYKRMRSRNTQLAEQNTLISKQKMEKEILLDEINHRVKNNLQIVSGLMEMQAMTTNSMLLREKLRDAQSRIQSIASVHTILYTNNQDVDIRFADFVEGLSEQVFSGMTDDSHRIERKIDIPKEVKFDMDRTIPLGLILNELFTNALKYAFAEKQDGVLEVILQEEMNAYILTVRDNGPGVSGASSPFEKQSMGMMIITSLSQQIHAELSYSFEKGAIFTLHITKEQNQIHAPS